MVTEIRVSVTLIHDGSGCGRHQRWEDPGQLGVAAEPGRQCSEHAERSREGDADWSDAKVAARLSDALFDGFPLMTEGLSAGR